MTLLSSVSPPLHTRPPALPLCVSFEKTKMAPNDARPPACQPSSAASAKRCSFSNCIQAFSHLAVNKRSLIHQILHLLLPTLWSDAVIFTSTPSVKLGTVFFFFFSPFSSSLIPVCESVSLLGVHTAGPSSHSPNSVKTTKTKKEETFFKAVLFNIYICIYDQNI